MVYQNNNLSFSKFLELDNSFLMHHIKLQVLVTFRQKNNLAPKIIKLSFQIQTACYNFHSRSSFFEREAIRTTHCGIQSVGYSKPKILNMIHDTIKKLQFTKWIKKINPVIDAWSILMKNIPYLHCPSRFLLTLYAHEICYRKKITFF